MRNFQGFLQLGLLTQASGARRSERQDKGLSVRERITYLLLQTCNQMTLFLFCLWLGAPRQGVKHDCGLGLDAGGILDQETAAAGRAQREGK